jgi:DNA polymerase-1
VTAPGERRGGESGQTSEGRESPARPSAQRRLFLIDGYALIYRAFFAMISRPLRTSRGENTSAVWGVANFLQRLFAEYRPTHVAWVHDSGTSFRSAVYRDYKATRQKLDEELQEDFDRSVERIRALLEAFRVPLVELEGYEADDVIGTLAERAAREGIEAVIVSGDKDFYQLIGPGISLLNPGRGGPAAVDEQWVDATNAHERMGVSPERVVDYLALVGDSSDNVPGVRGVGDKTARQLLEEYGSLDAILAGVADVKGKRAREALEAHADEARLSRTLVTIRRDVPVAIAFESLRAGTPDLAALRRLYAELEFHSLLPTLGEEPVSVPGAFGCRLMTEAAAVSEIVNELRRAPLVALHTELGGPDPLRAPLVGLSLAAEDGRAWYLPLRHVAPVEELSAARPPDNLPSLADPAMLPLVRLLEDEAVPKAGHDLKRDWLALRRAGVALGGVAYDAALASFVLDPGRRSHELDVLALEHLGLTLTPLSALVGKGKLERPFAEVTPPAAAQYCGAHGAAVLRLREHYAPELKRLSVGALLETIELPLLRVLVDMEWRGIRIDGQRLAALSREFGATLVELERGIYREAGIEFNINSTPQLRHVLFEKLNLPVLKRTKTGASTDAEVLQQLAGMGFVVPQLLLEYRELAKLKSTYVDVLPDAVNPETGRIHTRFNQTGASTGRLSSSDPNLQNIPVRTSRGERIRQCFVPEPGSVFVVADYSQIELRVLAHLSRDPAFIGAFERGGDIHRETAAIIFDIPVEAVTPEMRARAKTINFATIYGQGPFALSRQLGISQEEARAFIRLYFERFAGVRRFLDETVERARKTGYVETLFGRRRYIPELKDPNFSVRAFGERTAMNSPIQGSAADLIKVAMIRLHATLRAASLRSGILLQVHDELVVEAPEGEVDRTKTIVQEQMEGAAALAVPLVVETGVGLNWLDAKR